MESKEPTGCRSKKIPKAASDRIENSFGQRPKLSSTDDKIKPTKKAVMRKPVAPAEPTFGQNIYKMGPKMHTKNNFPEQREL